MKTPLKSIELELADCRAAFATHPTANWAWCCHHEKHCEQLTEPFEARIKYILSDKPKKEQAARFRNFRPVINTALLAPLYADYEAKRTTLYADYEAKRAPLYADYEAKRATLYADYEAKRAPLYADYEAKRTTLYADYEAKRTTLYADYEAKRAPLHNAEWPDNSWNGKSIFGHE